MSLLPHLGYGVGLRTKHYAEILDAWPRVDWFEIISENFLVAGGRPLHVLEQIREHYPIAMHGVSLSIGSTDPLDVDYLASLHSMAQRFEPAWISDHLCWTGVGGHNLHDLLPLPYTEEALLHVVERLRRVQDALGRQILLENVSTYFEYQHSVVPEWEFLSAVAERADCKILLDVNNIYVSAFNHGFDPHVYLNHVPIERVQQFHLAGHTDRGMFLHDTHDHPVVPAVWDLYAAAVRRFGSVSTLIEWDDHIPPFADVVAEAERAREVARLAAGRTWQRDADQRADGSSISDRHVVS
ncbi:MAG TPA: DUF692 domain-containing protein [Candidatus Acidoferrales bacterium]|nr:DUF692 domain-containing protein [Candidatus Acidoferrales bacterium]